MHMISDLIPRLSKLKTVVLPQMLGSSNVELFQSIKNELSNRVPPVRILLDTTPIYLFAIVDEKVKYFMNILLMESITLLL